MSGTTACAWDSVIDLDLMWKCLKRVIKKNGCIALFGIEPFSSYLRISNIDDYKYDWYWKKERPTNIMQVKKRAGKVIENISIFYENQCKYNPQKVRHHGKLVTNRIKNGSLGKLIDSNNGVPTSYQDDRTRFPIQLLEFNRDCLVNNLHPTQKPVALMKYLIKTYTDKNDIVLDFAMGSGTTGVACKDLDRKFIGIEKNEEYFLLAKSRIKNHHSGFKIGI